jgi:hypothetical protein
MPSEFVIIRDCNGHLNPCNLDKRDLVLKRVGGFVIFLTQNEEIRALPDCCVDEYIREPIYSNLKEKHTNWQF